MAPIFRIVSTDEPNGIFNNVDPGNFIYVKGGVLVSIANSNAAIDFFQGSNRITINGEVASAAGNGVELGFYAGVFEGEDNYVESNSNRLTIGETGIVAGQGGAAVQILGSNNTISNAGQILASADTGAAIYIRAGHDNHIFNSGDITSMGKGIDFTGTVDFLTSLGNNTISNSGVIESLGTGAASIAINGWVGNEIVVNTGRISGAVLLSDGADSYDGVLGRLFGQLDLGAGDDTAATGNNFDQIVGGAGDDSLDGGGGNDRFIALIGDGRDDIDGGDGSDTLVGSNRSWTVDLTNGTAFDGTSTDILENIENFTGNNRDDTVTGSAAGNSLIGSFGDDTLIGLGGNDRLSGGQNEDVLTGGAGRDILAGGGGGDVFDFDAVNESPVAGHDIILDFTHGGAQADKVDLSSIDANSGAGGNQAFSLLPTLGASFTGVAGQLRYYQASGSTFIEGDVDGNSAADIQIQLIGLYNVLAPADFSL